MLKTIWAWLTRDWKTSGSGLLILIALLLHNWDYISEEHFGYLVALLTTGGLILAKDSKKGGTP